MTIGEQHTIQVEDQSHKMLKLKDYSYLEEDNINKENLIKDEGFISDAYDFLYKRNNNTNLNTAEEVYNEFMEHMRYSSVNEITALRDLEYAQNATEEDKDSFGRLIDVYDRMPGEDLSWRMMLDYAEGLATAPSTYLGIITGGTGKAAAVAGTQTARLGLRKALTSIPVGGKLTAKKAAEQKFKQQLTSGVSRAMAVEGSIGAGQGLIEEGTRVETEVQDKVTGGRALTTGLASAIGAGIVSVPFAALGAKKATRASELKAKYDLETLQKANMANAESQKVLKETSKEKIDEIKETLKALDLDKVKEGRAVRNYLSDSDELIAGLPKHVFENIAAATIRVKEKLNMKKGDRITATVQKAMANGDIVTNDITKILKEHNITVDQFSLMYKSEISDAGRILGTQSLLKRNLNRQYKEAVDKQLGDLDALRTAGLSTISREEAEALLTNDTAIYGFFRDLDRLRLGLMTSQPATTARNNLNAGFRVGVDASIRTIDNIIHNIVMPGRGRDTIEGLTKLYREGAITEEIFKQRKKQAEAMFGSRGLFDGTLDVAKYTFNQQEAKIVRQLYTELYPEQSAILFRQNADIDIGMKNDTILADIGRKFNIANSLSDNFWKQAVFASSLGRTVKDKTGKELFEIIERGALDELPDEFFQKAYDDALEFTYQNSFRENTRFNNIAKGVIKYQRDMPFAISMFLPFPRFIASQLKFIGEHAPIFSQLKLAKDLVNKAPNEKLVDVWKKDAGKRMTGALMLSTAFAWRMKQGDTNYWYEIKDNQGNIIDGRPLYGPFSMFMLMADIGYRAMTGTLPPKVGNYIRDGLQATLGSTFRVGLGLTLLDNLYQNLNSPKGTKILGEIAGDILNTYMIPFSVVKDLYSQFDPESRMIPETRVGGEVNLLDYMYSRAFRSLPDFPLTQGLGEGYADPMFSAFQTGPLQAVNPLEKQLFGFGKRKKKNVLQEEMGRLNLTTYNIYRRNPNNLIDRYTRRELARADSPYNMSQVLEGVIKSDEYQALGYKARRQELIDTAKYLIKNAKQLAKDRIVTETEARVLEGEQITYTETDKALWEETSVIKRDAANEEYKKLYGSTIEEDEAYGIGNILVKKSRGGRLGLAK
jgi:hypothetical protein